MIEWRFLIEDNHGGDKTELARAYLAAKIGSETPIIQPDTVYSDSGNTEIPASEFWRAYQGSGSWTSLDQAGIDPIWGVVSFPTEEWPVELVLKASGWADRAPKDFRLQYRLDSADPWQDQFAFQDEPVWAANEERRYLVAAAFLSGSTRDKNNALAVRTIRIISEADDQLYATVVTDGQNGTFTVPAQKGKKYSAVAAGESGRNDLIFAGVQPFAA